MRSTMLVVVLIAHLLLVNLYSATQVPLECASIGSNIFVIVSLTPNITFVQFSTLMHQFIAMLNCTSQMSEGGMLLSIETPGGVLQTDCTGIVPITASEMDECLRDEFNDTRHMKKFHRAATATYPNDIHPVDELHIIDQMANALRGFIYEQTMLEYVLAKNLVLITDYVIVNGSKPISALVEYAKEADVLMTIYAPSNTSRDLIEQHYNCCFHRIEVFDQWNDGPDEKLCEQRPLVTFPPSQNAIRMFIYVALSNRLTTDQLSSIDRFVHQLTDRLNTTELSADTDDLWRAYDKYYYINIFEYRNNATYKQIQCPWLGIVTVDLCTRCINRYLSNSIDISDVDDNIFYETNAFFSEMISSLAHDNALHRYYLFITDFVSIEITKNLANALNDYDSEIIDPEPYFDILFLNSSTSLNMSEAFNYLGTILPSNNGSNCHFFYIDQIDQIDSILPNINFDVNATTDSAPLMATIPYVNNNRSDNNDDDEQKNRTKAILLKIVLPITVLLLISTLISIILIYHYCCCCSSKRSNIAHIKSLLFRRETQRGPSDDPTAVSVDVTDGTDEDNIWEIPWRKIQIQHDKVLGKGAYATVFRGHLFGKAPIIDAIDNFDLKRFQDCDVAIKIPHDFGHSEAEELIREIETMKRISRHTNIATMIGYVKWNNVVCSVMELADTDLQLYVCGIGDQFAKQQIDRIPTTTLMAIARQITSAMSYLAKRRMVHRDLAARNILLQVNELRAMISDFGLCSDCDENFSYISSTNRRLPIKWLALEAIIDNCFSEKSDVYSFGIVLFEIFSLGERPYSTVAFDQLTKFLLDERRMDQPTHATDDVYNLMLQCWMTDAFSRPTFAQLYDIIGQLIEKQASNDSYGYVSAIEFRKQSIANNEEYETNTPSNFFEDL